eukprot:symbB.v1.2.040330.t1/scaffold7117.1/size26037/2
MWSNFYDDYVTFALEENAINTEATVGLLFDLLGWNFAVEGDKASGFDLKFSALGIVVNLEHFLDGYVEFCNTEKRAKELSETIQCFVKSGTMSLLESQRLRGRMQFADGQLFGRIGQLCLRAAANLMLDALLKVEASSRYSDDAPMETESEKARRYQHQRLDESSDVEFWMSLHHHEGSEEDPASPMQVDSEAPPDQATQEAALEDYAATVERARRVFWDRQDEFLQAGDYDGLDRFNSQYSWLDYV